MTAAQSVKTNFVLSCWAQRFCAVGSGCSGLLRFAGLSRCCHRGPGLPAPSNRVSLGASVPSSALPASALAPTPWPELGEAAVAGLWHSRITPSPIMAGMRPMPSALLLRFCSPAWSCLSTMSRHLCMLLIWLPFQLCDQNYYCTWHGVSVHSALLGSRL